MKKFAVLTGILVVALYSVRVTHAQLSQTFHWLPILVFFENADGSQPFDPEGVDIEANLFDPDDNLVASTTEEALNASGLWRVIMISSADENAVYTLQVIVNGAEANFLFPLLQPMRIMVSVPFDG